MWRYYLVLAIMGIPLMVLAVRIPTSDEPCDGGTGKDLVLTTDISVANYSCIEIVADGNSIAEIAKCLREHYPADCNEYSDISITLNGITKDVSFEELFTLAGFK